MESSQCGMKNLSNIKHFEMFNKPDQSWYHSNFPLEMLRNRAGRAKRRPDYDYDVKDNESISFNLHFKSFCLLWISQLSGISHALHARMIWRQETISCLLGPLYRNILNQQCQCQYMEPYYGNISAQKHCKKCDCCPVTSDQFHALSPDYCYSGSQVLVHVLWSLCYNVKKERSL